MKLFFEYRISNPPEAEMSKLEGFQFINTATFPPPADSVFRGSIMF
jgi:hypothetical protein